MFPDLGIHLRRAGYNIHVDTYVFYMSAAFIVSLIASIPVSIIGMYLLRNMFMIVIPIAMPMLTLSLMYIIPIISESGKASAIDSELPYMVSYLSTIMMSGISPYMAFERLGERGHILTKTAGIIKKFITFTRALGKDPISALSEVAERVPSVRFQETLSGCIAAIESGGDVIDYLNRKARVFFNDMIIGLKIIADRLGGLLESYLALVLLTLISFTVLYLATVAFAEVVPFGLSPFSMFLFLYIILPLLSGVVIYLADIIQYKEPLMDWKPIIVYMGTTIPITIFLSLFGILFYNIPNPYHPLRANMFTQLIGETLSLFGLSSRLPYTRTSVVLSMSLLLATIPSVIYYEKASKEQKVIKGITRFLRDLVEVRKTGLTPEKSIIELSKRDYGIFSKYLKKISMLLTLGTPLRIIIESTVKNVKSWKGRVLLFVLLDSIEVGGGTPEVLENLAWFAESVETVEEEKRKSLRTLMIVPYMGALIATVTIIYMVGFMRSLPIKVGAFNQAAELVLPSIVINNYVMGIVAGKVSSGTICAGFKHALALTLFTTITLISLNML
ncbi:MAG: type II secretion system F family protein [Desulfurococcaceae archaeon]